MPLLTLVPLSGIIFPPLHFSSAVLLYSRSQNSAQEPLPGLHRAAQAGLWVGPPAILAVCKLRVTAHPSTSAFLGRPQHTVTAFPSRADVKLHPHLSCLDSKESPSSRGVSWGWMEVLLCMLAGTRKADSQESCLLNRAVPSARPTFSCHSNLSQGLLTRVL